MTDTKAFDVTKLQPGDEVGIEILRGGEWKTWSANRVAWIHDDLIGLEGDEWYQSDGRHGVPGVGLRLAAPTEEGRRVTLQETVATDLDILASQTRSMDLATLRRLKAWLDAKGWEAEPLRGTVTHDADPHGPACDPGEWEAMPDGPATKGEN